jgi:hypothetical protein
VITLAISRNSKQGIPYSFQSSAQSHLLRLTYRPVVVQRERPEEENGGNMRGRGDQQIDDAGP